MLLLDKLWDYLRSLFVRESRISRSIGTAVKIMIPRDAPTPTIRELREQLKIKTFAEDGSASSVPILKSVGEICNAFEGIHDELVDLYAVLVAKSGHAAGQAIKEKRDFAEKLAMCGKANNANTENEEVALAVKQWLTLCHKASEIRNMVIHGRPVNIHYVGASGPTRGFFLAPSIDRLPEPIGLTKGRYCWNIVQLREYRASFVVLAAMLMTVREELSRSGDEPHPEVLIPVKRRNI